MLRNDDTLKFRLPGSELEAWKKRSQELGVSLSGWVRHVCNTELNGDRIGQLKTKIQGQLLEFGGKHGVQENDSAVEAPGRRHRGSEGPRNDGGAEKPSSTQGDATVPDRVRAERSASPESGVSPETCEHGALKNQCKVAHCYFDEVANSRLTREQWERFKERNEVREPQDVRRDRDVPASRRRAAAAVAAPGETEKPVAKRAHVRGKATDKSRKEPRAKSSGKWKGMDVCRHGIAVGACAVCKGLE